MMQMQMPKLAKKLAQILSVYEKIAGGWGSALDPIVTAVCLLYFNIADIRQGPGKMLLGS